MTEIALERNINVFLKILYCKLQFCFQTKTRSTLLCYLTSPEELIPNFFHQALSSGSSAAGRNVPAQRRGGYAYLPPCKGCSF